MKTLRDHPAAMTAVAIAIAAATVAVIAGGWGWSAFADAWTHLHPGWLVLAIGAALLTVPSYSLAYHSTARAGGGPRLAPGFVTRVVIAGFGAFTPCGGFALDRRALEGIGADEERATVRVLGLGALEWAVLAPAACVSAVALLAVGDTRPMPSLLWPWALAVPAGFGIGLWLSAGPRRERLSRGRPHVELALRGVAVLRALAAHPRRHVAAWIGAAGYWALDIAGFYSALRFIGLRPNMGETVLAFATGYALTRRSLPLGGAGVTEALMTFALHWVGLPIPAALASVAVYRVFNFILPTIPALLVMPRVTPLLDASDDDRAHATREPSIARGEANRAA